MNDAQLREPVGFFGGHPESVIDRVQAVAGGGCAN